MTRFDAVSDRNFRIFFGAAKFFVRIFKSCEIGAKIYVGKIQLYQNWYYTALVLYASIIRDTGALVSVLSRTKSNMQSCFVARRFLVALEATFHRTSTSQMNPRSKQCLIPFHLRFARPLTVAHLRLPFAIPWPTAMSQRRAFLIMADMYSACACLR